MANTIYITYQFEGVPYSANTSFGFSTPIHCNYIEKLEVENLANSTISLIFDKNEFPFLADNSSTQNITGGTGWSAYKINALIQILNITGDTAIPDAAAWKKIDITNQTQGWVSGETLQRTGITSTLYTVSVPEVTAAPTYDLSYLNYPTELQVDRLAWGEEAFFFGNIKTNIKAIVYTTDIPIVLPLNEFNSTTNPTWNGVSAISVSEVGIYDDNGNLVGIGKLNNPINKDSTIARTILFEIDF